MRSLYRKRISTLLIFFSEVVNLCCWPMPCRKIYLHNFSFELLHLNWGWLQSLLFWWKACFGKRLKNEQKMNGKSFLFFFQQKIERVKYRKGHESEHNKKRYLEVLNNEILFTVGNLLHQIAAFRHGVMLMKNFRFISRSSRCFLPLYCSFYR